MGHLLRLGAYLAVIGIAAFIAASDGRRRRIGIAVLFAYVVVIHAAVLIANREAWPFGNYRAMHGRARLEATLWRVDFAGVDASGREWVLDAWAFESIHQVPMQLWAMYYMNNLPPHERRLVLAHMLEVAEKSRARLAAGKRVGAERILGPLAAPSWYGTRRIREVSREPFRALRIYHVEWNAKRRDEDRWVIGEWPPR